MSKESAAAMLQSTIPAPTQAPAPGPETGAKGGTPGLQAVPEPAQLESTRFAHLAKKEAELVKQREAFKKDQESVNQEKEKLRSVQQKLQTFEELRGKDAIAAIKSLGFTDTEIMNYFASLEDTSTPEERAAKAAQGEIKKFQDEQAAKEAKANETRNTQVLDQFKKDISKQVASDKDKYEYCNYNGPLAEELIYETVAAVLESDKVIISVQEAADMVEDYYEQQDKSMSTLKKRQPKVEATEVVQEEPLKAQVAPRPSTPSKTLSSRTTATVASTTVLKKETQSEKKARLINKLANLGKQ